MYRIGLWFIGAACGLAALGVFFSEPSGRMPERINLIRVALDLEVQMIRLSEAPTRYLVNVPAYDWLLGCLALALIGAVMMAAARWRGHAHS
ncbi:hypothetical protein [Cupriavidus plantarum]|uniref:hypothetical protein n=1 Tax=Cupriavidus plantarum TaxID=942865 RepID=UPI000EAE12B1|nr:hypothetical protein [Cupriavidus plantarum]RLK31629.1 hypothetical protein C7417_4606 [Cupriavidus plantarum]